MTSVGMDIICMATGPMANNCILLVDQQSQQAAVVDPGLGSEQILKDFTHRASITMILLTHGHFDHVAELSKFKSCTNANIGIHRADEELMLSAPEYASEFGFSVPPSPTPDFYLDPEEPLYLGSSIVHIRHTPGHTPGSVALIASGTAIVGDTLFAGSVGRTDLPGGSYEELMRSIHDQLLTLPDETSIITGHGPSTSIGLERRTNPFILQRLECLG